MSYGIIFDTTFKLVIDLTNDRSITATTNEVENNKIITFSVVMIERDNPKYVSQL
jgi:hypothetical protein